MIARGVDVHIADVVLQMSARLCLFSLVHKNGANVFPALKSADDLCLARLHERDEDPVGKGLVTLGEKMQAHGVALGAPRDRLVRIRRSAEQPERHHVAAIRSDLVFRQFSFHVSPLERCTFVIRFTLSGRLYHTTFREKMQGFYAFFEAETDQRRAAGSKAAENVPHAPHAFFRIRTSAMSSPSLSTW